MRFHALLALIALGPAVPVDAQTDTIVDRTWDEVVARSEIAAGPDRAQWLPDSATVSLGYAYLQQGRYREAYAHLERMRAQMQVDAPEQRAAFARMRADYVINTGEWDTPALDWPIELDTLPGAAAMDAFVAGAAALTQGDRVAASRAIADIQKHQLLAARGQDVDDASATVIAILLKELSGLLMLEDRADSAEVLRSLREAVALEDALRYEFGPPGVVKPAHELMGEVLLELGRPREAVAAFERALERTPKRARSLMGLARAAETAGDQVLEDATLRTLRRIWHRADQVPTRGNTPLTLAVSPRRRRGDQRSRRRSSEIPYGWFRPACLSAGARSLIRPWRALRGRSRGAASWRQCLRVR